MATLQPTGNAGEYMIPELGNKKIRLIDWREDDLFDVVAQPSGAVTAGTSLEYFRDLSNKNLQHTNLRTPRRIPSQSEFILQRVGVVLAQAYSNTVSNAADLIKAAYAATLTFKINDRVVTEGPLFKFQSGYGMQGTSTETTTSIVTTGVPSSAAAPRLLVEQVITDSADLMGTIDFKSDSWITGSAVMPTFANKVLVQLMLHGLWKRPSNA